MIPESKCTKLSGENDSTFFTPFHKSLGTGSGFEPLFNIALISGQDSLKSWLLIQELSSKYIVMLLSLKPNTFKFLLILHNATANTFGKANPGGKSHPCQASIIIVLSVPTIDCPFIKIE